MKASVVTAYGGPPRWARASNGRAGHWPESHCDRRLR